MPSLPPSAIASTVAAVLVALVVIMKLFPSSRSSAKASSASSRPPEPLSEAVVHLLERLKNSVPEGVILSRQATAYASATGHWAQQECETIPACIAQPRNKQELSCIISLLKDEHVKPGQHQAQAIFAVRAGGHSAVAGAASIKGGLLIDLGRFKEVKVSDDRTSVRVGAGARWIDVFTLLDSKGLATIGGRNSHVGVGGLTLGGGISFFSPRYGLVCSNVLEYEIVLASGSITTASETTNPDLWKALKGGANNFGIVTQFTLRCFPSRDIWAGFLYIPGNKQNQVLAAFHEAAAKADPSHPAHDKSAAGPIACFTYLQGVPFQIISVSLVYTTSDNDTKSKWPAYWRSSSFASIWRIWSTVRPRSLADATDEMNSLNPPGRRQVLAATTVKNDPATLSAAYAAYKNAQSSVKRIKGISWTLVMQPLAPEWARKGDPNPLGLDEGSSEPLVMISFTVNWGIAKDDAFAKEMTRRTVDEIESFARAHGTTHRYRYLNYCGDWQDPFEGYGEENLGFLQDVSRRYDPSGLFQTGCTGGFKLWKR